MLGETGEPPPQRTINQEVKPVNIEFDKRSIEDRNSILFNKGEDYPEYLQYLRNNGWFSGSWCESCIIILKNGLLIPVGQGHHEPTTAKALKEEGIELPAGSPSGKEFIRRGGVTMSSNVASIDKLSVNDPRLITLLKYMSHYYGSNPESYGHDLNIQIYTDDYKYTFNLEDIIKVNFDISKIEPISKRKSLVRERLDTEEKRVVNSQLGEALWNNVKILTASGCSQREITFYKYWYKRIYIDKEFHREALYYAVDEKLSKIEDIIKNSRKLPE